MSTWLLPEFIADVLPSEARHIENLRRQFLDTAHSYGYELVMPPMLEHLESLLGDYRQELDLKTFKLVDQLSGRTLGIRADTTPQVARIDAHLLNRGGAARLCYCGPVLHTVPSDLYSTRESLQFGAELYGHAGQEADLEILTLAVEALHRIGVDQIVLDLADIRVVRGLFSGVLADQQTLQQIYGALSNKDADELEQLTRQFPDEIRGALLALLDLYGDVSVLDKAQQILPERASIHAALDDLRNLARNITSLSGVKLRFDLADLRGYGYYTGMRFSLYAPGSNAALLRGGRYDEVGAVYGRNRSAVGFSLDVKALTGLAKNPGPKLAILAPWGNDPQLNQMIRHLREQKEVVVRVLPGQEQYSDEFYCDRELVLQDGNWIIRPFVSHRT